MHTLSKPVVSQLLLERDLKIGNWNEIADMVPGATINEAHPSPRDALPLYVFSSALMNWVTSGGWILFQIDNSTAPTDDEIRVFERIVFAGKHQWNVSEEKSFLLSGASKELGAPDETTLVLLIFFSLLFEWHVHLTSEFSAKGQRLSLQDGIVYFFGDVGAVERAKSLINQLNENPLLIPR